MAGSTFNGRILVNNSTSNNWKRPSDWLPIPAIADGEQVVYFLYWATDNDSNYVAFRFSGAYTVDWGDASIQNVNSGTTATHLFDYATLSNQIVVDGITYRQALIKVTPQAGQDLTIINTTVSYGSPVSAQRTYRIKEISISMPNATTYSIGGSTNNISSCEHLNFINAGVDPSFQSLGIQLYNLKKISFKITPSPISLSGFLNQTYGNVDVDDINYSNVTNISSMLINTRGIKSLVASMPALTTASSAFSNNYGTAKVELSDTSLLTNISSIANGARALVSLKILDASAVTTTTTAFSMTSNPPGCSLEEVVLGGITVGFSVTSLLMSAKTIDAMFTALGTASGSQTIDVRNNPGSLTCDPSIATAKGYTVLTA